MSGIGHIGEIRIIDFLKKKKGMAVYLPLKDKGIDFIAVKRDSFYQIQVKTSMFQKGSYFWFDLYKHKMVYSKDTFYIFVCITMNRRQFMGKANNYVILPSLKLKKWITSRDIVSKQGDNSCLNIFLYPDKERKRWVYRNKGKELDWTPYWNNFSYFA
jgi:hypothetical protein